MNYLNFKVYTVQLDRGEQYNKGIIKIVSGCLCCTYIVRGQYYTKHTVYLYNTRLYILFRKTRLICMINTRHFLFYKIVYLTSTIILRHFNKLKKKWIILSTKTLNVIFSLLFLFKLNITYKVRLDKIFYKYA